MLLEAALADFSEERKRNSTSRSNSNRSSPRESPGGSPRKSVSIEEKKQQPVGSPAPWDERHGRRSVDSSCQSSSDVQRKFEIESGEVVESPRNSGHGEGIVNSVVDDSTESSSSDEGRRGDAPEASGKGSSSGDERKAGELPKKYSGNSTTYNEPRHVSVLPDSSFSLRRSPLNAQRQNAVRLRDSLAGEEPIQGQAEPGDKKVTQNRQEVQYYGREAILFEWEDATAKNVLQESPSSSRSNHPGHLRSPQAPRAATNSTVSTSPERQIGDARSGNGISEATKLMLGGKGQSQRSRKGGVRTTSPQRSPHRSAPDWNGSSREEVDRESISGYSDEGSSLSPVSTLDLPLSPLSPTYSHTQETVVVGRHRGNSRSGTATVTPATASGSHSMSSAFVSLSEMSEELPSVMEEEEEEDVESVTGFHTIEFQTMESPAESEDREDWSRSGRKHSSKSMSAPHSRRGSSLRPEPANRGRRRSDFDWPEDFDERPEEVVKEVDDSLWAFSPVASTFVFSGNEASPTVRPGLTNTSTPGSSPGIGSVLEHLSLKRSFVRSAFSSKPANGMKKSGEVGPPFGEFPSRRKSSRFRQYAINGDDDYFSGSGTPQVKKSAFSCMPLFSLCGSQRPRPSISFSQRLSPGPRR